MNVPTRWIQLDGAVNVRDLGGLATTEGRTTRLGRVLRSDNLQDLTPGDVRRLTTEFGLHDVIDLRSHPEVRLEGPGPLTRAAGVTIHHLSLFSEGGLHTDVVADAEVDIDRVLPWQTRQDASSPEQHRSISHYLGYVRDRPDSIVNALRVMAYGRGSALVHCAAGKDRTGVVCAIALETVGVTREAVVADYVQTGERLEAILRRLRSSQTYAGDLDSRPGDSHLPHAFIMDKFLAKLDEHHGGAIGWLHQHGWTATDSAALRRRLVED